MSFLGDDALTLGEVSDFIVENIKGSDSESEGTVGADKNSSTETLVFDIKSVEKFISGSLQAVLGVTSESLGVF